MIHKENVLQVFDSSQCLKAEALLVSTATREREKVFRSISDLQRRSEFLTKVVPTRFSKQISNIGDECCSSLHGPHPLRVPSRRGLETGAHRGGSRAIAAAGARPGLGGGQVLRCPPPQASTAAECAAALSVCASSAALPSQLQISHLSD